ncbi:MAG: hypothetical protein ACOY3J_06490 [Bacillota bacterium]|uniref:Uncharacterized protein n=1 Tax=Thermanaerosceptrum fracticalcis TaxID=1712410 RepID=A0A7G6E686_THEFR|nr:hypothetical protein [Thermanaerosceptrum fracticalcis]QNB47590.1 hypothetical protein BR63_15700 [Thermanaerosceptrum fracticalcis]
MHLLRSLIPVILSFLLLFSPSQAYGQGSTASLFIVLIPGLNLEDLKAPQLNHLQGMAAKGSLGLMNTLSGSSKHLPSAYLTLGSGFRAIAPKEGILGLEKTEEFHDLKAVDLYTRYTGNLPGDASIVHPYYYAVAAANLPDLQPGALGTILEKNAVPVALLGNHDLPGILSRPGVLFAMDKTGKVAEGAIDQRCNKISTFSPTYYTTNYAYLLKKTKEILQGKKGLIILDLGDLARLENLREEMAPDVYQKTRESMLAEIDVFMGQLRKLSQEHGAGLLFITPYPSKTQALKGNTLAPVIYYPNRSTSGLLSSASTKRTGIITNLDVAPTVLNFFNIDYAGVFIGSPLQVIPRENSLDFLFDLQEKLLANHQQRPQILKPYVFLQIVVVLSTICLLWLRHPWIKYCRSFLLLLTLVPLLLLLLPLFPGIGLIPRILFILSGLILSTAVLEKKCDLLKRLAYPYLLTAFLIVVDLLQGAPLMKNSLLGYDPISGARYYGIGNEYMGVLLGSSLMGLSLLTEAFKFYLPKVAAYLMLPLLAGFLTCLVSAPQWGTNVGGGITFLLSFAIFLLTFFQRKINTKSLITLGLCTMLALTALFYFDLKRPLEAQSHIGLAARIIQEQGLASFFPIASRKIAMNIKLIRYTIWSRVFMTFLGTFALLFYRPPGLVKRLMERYPGLKAGFGAGITGSLVALIMNDSGIVAAATSMIFVAPTLLYLAVESIAKDEG